MADAKLSASLDAPQNNDRVMRSTPREPVTAWRLLLEVGVYKLGSQPTPYMIGAALLKAFVDNFTPSSPVAVVADFAGDHMIGEVRRIELRAEGRELWGELSIHGIRPLVGEVPVLCFEFDQEKSMLDPNVISKARVVSVGLSRVPVFAEHIPPEERARRMAEVWR